MTKVSIEFNVANVLLYLGSMYKNAADALKEHISNAIDAHIEAKKSGMAHEICKVDLYINKKEITMQYPYGMSRKEFNEVLKRVADSSKKGLDIEQIGRLGIGMFSFFQIGQKGIFLSKKDKNSDTIKVTIKEGSPEAVIETARKKESLSSPRIKIIISSLKSDPTKQRRPLSILTLKRFLAEKFDAYIKNGDLQINIYLKEKCYKVEPLEINLQRVRKHFKEWPLPIDRSKKIHFELYFDPLCKGKVSIRHTGVTVVDDFQTLSDFGLDESIYNTGDITGFIDANFLEPLPSRRGFEDNKYWVDFLEQLCNLSASLEDEVEELKSKEAEKKMTQIQKQALEIAREILAMHDFDDLELLGGLVKSRRPI